MRARTLGAILATLLISACLTPGWEDASTQDARDHAQATRLVAQFDSLRQSARIPGLAVVILRDSTVLAAAGLGMADLARHLPVTPETPFDIASVAKPIAAVVALRLVEQGLLDLDRPMQSFANFPEYCADTKGAGGIFFADFACLDPGLTLRHVLSMTANGKPGTRFWYNPPVYSWASRPMAEVADTTYSDLVRTLVFQPAGMIGAARRHRRLPLPEAIAAALAQPYHLDSGGRPVPSPPLEPQGDGAAGGVIASAMDLARFDIALGQGRLLSRASLTTMWTASRDPTGRALPYGLGWFVAAWGEEPAFWHTGLWEGAYSALYLKAPDRGLTLILLANSDGLGWSTGLDEARLDRSPFVRAFFAAFPR